MGTAERFLSVQERPRDWIRTWGPLPFNVSPGRYSETAVWFPQTP